MAAVAVGVFIATVDGSIVNVALPTLTDAFDASIPAIQWVVLGYLLTIGTLLLIMGRLGDMFGKKGIYAAGFSIFTIASMAAGLAPTVGALIGFRVVQAIGAAMIQSLGVAILTEAFPSSERGRALGLIGSVVSLGIITGPTLGGILIDRLDWRWIFFVNLPIGLIGTLAALKWVPNVRPPGRTRFDWLGAATLFATLISLLLGLTLGQSLGFAAPPILGLYALSALALWAFIAVEKRADAPMIDLTIFRNALFTVNLVNGFLVFMPLAGILFIAPFFLTEAMQLPPLRVGLALASAPIALGLIAPLAGTAADRIGPRRITVAGLAVLTVAYVTLQGLDTDTGFWRFVLLLIPIGVGMAIFQSPNNSIIMGSVSPERLGVAGGLLSLTRIMGQLGGIAVLGTIWSVETARSGGLSSPEAVVSGTRLAVWVGFGSVTASLLLALWGWRVERQRARALSAQASS